jgi:hypothetical protein
VNDPRPERHVPATYTERHHQWSLAATVIGLLLAGVILGGGVGLAATHVIALAVHHVSAAP